MKISVNDLQYYQRQYKWSADPMQDGVAVLVQKIGAQLGAVEEVIPMGKRFEGVVVVKVVRCQPHPQADRLHVCLIDDGGVVGGGVERTSEGYVQVVCGAPNVRAGLTVAWLPPGSIVPSTFGDTEFKLEVRELRGIKSNGMLASAKELSLGDNHEGIFEITDDVLPGTPFADAFNLRDETIIDIENKMFTHRPDLFGWMGVARELAGISQLPFRSPDWYVLQPEIPNIETEILPLTVRNELPELVPRFTAITLRNVQVGPSPTWLQVSLARVGVRSINNIVDYTNYFMLLTGQPLHAYDYDKVAARSKDGQAAIVVRSAHDGEKMTLLSGKTIQFSAHEHRDILIATDKEAIGLGGVMGGADTEVDEHTKNIILESATFDMYAIRRTSMKWGIFSDAVTRFTKGQSPLQNVAVLAKIVDEIRRFAGGKVAGEVVDIRHLPARVLQDDSVHPPVEVAPEFINTRLGLRLNGPQIATLLRNVEFEVTETPHGLRVKAPFWRTDIEIPEDIVEEVGRLYGYDHLPLELPMRDLTPAKPDPMHIAKERARTILASAGAQEVLTYSFVHTQLLEKTGQDSSHAFRLANALSPDLEHFRLSLTPSLLEKVHPNIKAGFTHHALFEINKTHSKERLDEERLPLERTSLALVLAQDAACVGAPYFYAKRYLAFLLEALHVQFEVVPMNPVGGQDSIFTPFEPKRAGYVKVNGEIIGIVGEYTAKTRRNLKLPETCAGFEIDFDAVYAHQGKKTYQHMLRFPSTDQDVCFKVPTEISYAQLEQYVCDAMPDDPSLRVTVAPVDIYQRTDEAEFKQITFRITLQHSERTLTTPEVTAAIEQSVAQVAKKAGAQRI